LSSAPEAVFETLKKAIICIRSSDSRPDSKKNIDRLIKNVDRFPANYFFLKTYLVLRPFPVCSRISNLINPVRFLLVAHAADMRADTTCRILRRFCLQPFPCQFNCFVSLFFRYDDPSKLMKGKKTVFRSIGSNLIWPHIALLMDISYIRAIKHVKDNKL